MDSIFEDFKNKINKIVESDRAFEKLIKPFVEAKAEAKNSDFNELIIYKPALIGMFERQHAWTVKELVPSVHEQTNLFKF